MIVVLYVLLCDASTDYSAIQLNLKYISKWEWTYD